MSTERGSPVPWEDHPWGPREWQAKAFPEIVHAVRSSRGECKPVVVAWMGAGKSVLLTELARHSSLTAPDMTVVVIAPTQKLVEQLADTVRMRCPTVGRFYGRVKEPHRNVIVCCYPSLPALAKVLERSGRTVGLLIADECHQSQADVIREAIRTVNPKVMVGFSATPFRGDGQALELFSDVVYKYTMGDGIRDGVLVDLDWRFAPPGTAKDADLDDLCVDMIRREAPPGPGVASARSIADATSFAERLCEEGIESLPIHSRLSSAVQARRVEMLRTGAVRVLVHVNMLAEGVDFPWLRWLCLRKERGTGGQKGGPRMFLQEIGRVGRVLKEPDQWGGKDRGVILDPLGQFFERNLQNDPMLGGNNKPEAADAVDNGGRYLKLVYYAFGMLPWTLPQAASVTALSVFDLEDFVLKWEEKGWVAPGWLYDGGSRDEFLITLKGEKRALWTREEEAPEIHAVGAAQIYALNLRRTLEMYGWPVEAMVESWDSRQQPQSKTQGTKLRTALRDAGRFLPSVHIEDVGWLLTHPMDRGTSSDLLSALWAVNKAKAWPADVTVERLDRRGALDLFSGRVA